MADKPKTPKKKEEAPAAAPKPRASARAAAPPPEPKAAAPEAKPASKAAPAPAPAKAATPAPAAASSEHEHKTHSFRRRLLGRVVSDKMDKTVVVEVIRRSRNQVYKKYVHSRDRYKAHDEKNEFKLGD